MRWPFKRRSRDREIAEELQAHFRLAIADRMAAGQTEEDARRAAIREFGNIGLATEVTRAVWSFPFEQLLQDLRFSLRTLAKVPGFSASAIGSLALGIGATTAIFSVVYGVILDPFPYADPETLLSFSATIPGKNFYYSPSTPDGFLAVQERIHAFSDVIASTISDVSWTAMGEPQRLRGNFCSSNTFDVMGVKPLLGRAMTRGDDAEQAEAIVVLGYKFWMRQFAGDHGVIGRKLRLNDTVRTVVGVMPKRFMWRGADVYLPVAMRRGQPLEDAPFLFIMGRLRPGATRAQAAAELTPVLTDLVTEEFGERPQNVRIIVRDFFQSFPSGIQHSLWILLGAVGVLLLIACANVSSLMLSRAAVRGREMAIRSFLGAGRTRIFRLLLTESASLGLGAGAGGVVLAILGLHFILAIVPPDTIPDESDITLNLPVLAFTLSISLAAALLFGLAPAWQAGRARGTECLKAGGRGISGAFGEARMRNFFVVLEVALAMVLLVGASLVVRTLLHVQRVQVGVQPERTLSMTIPLSKRRYPTAEKRNDFYRELLQRTVQIPGVKAVALNQSVHPFIYSGVNVTAPQSEVTSKTQVVLSQISPQYMQFVNARLVQGRLMGDPDLWSSHLVAIINQKLASTFFPHGDAIGHSLHLLGVRPRTDARSDEVAEIVGVVSDLPNVGLTESIAPEAYVPFTMLGYQHESPTLLATGVGEPTAYVRAIQKELHTIDPDQPLMDIQTLRQWLDRNGYSEPKFSVFLFGVFASLGLFLAALGIFAVINFSVLRQTQEIGVRMALGAQRSVILKMVVRSGLKLLGVGALLGLLGSLGTTHLLRGMLSGVSPLDPLSFLVVLLLIMIVGVLACLRPALRAAAIDPMTALRQE